MDAEIPLSKSYFRISEVSKILGVKPYVIRFWESEFKTVRPIRTKADQRLYRKQDVQELLNIKNLLYEELFTIKGAKKQLLARKQTHTHQISESIIRQKLEAMKDGLLQIQELLKSGHNKAG
jgi:DNA-binding transcriptional MerR regulator